MKEVELDKKFKEFHRTNPHVYEILVRLAREAKSAGKKKISVVLLVQVARWELMFRTESDDGFKINNSYTSRYARLIMENEADLVGFFELRKLAKEGAKYQSAG
ncbi:hypothetical protein AB3N02_21710 [Priestia aryabhattai]|uniref:hypothetical protein n=1 Tax=Priestia aryabhattai TaxID=412384 RepID=UPI0039A2D987